METSAALGVAKMAPVSVGDCRGMKLGDSDVNDSGFRGGGRDWR